MDSPSNPLAKPMANRSEPTVVKLVVIGAPSAALSSLTVDTHNATLRDTIVASVSLATLEGVPNER